MDFILLLLFDLLLEVVGEVGLAKTRAFDTERTGRGPAVLVFAPIGCGFGALSTLVLPERILRPGPFRGMSLMVIPLLLAGAMHMFGVVRTSRDEDTSHLATWYGGASMRLGLSGGRLGALMLQGSL